MDPKNTPDDRPLSVPARNGSISVRRTDRDAAAQIMRQQIDQLYDNQPSQTVDTESAAQKDTYHQTHSETVDHAASASHTDQWKQYHTQWQNYYQQYYERYYLSQLATRQQKLAGHQLTASTTPAMVTAGEPEPETLNKSQAVNELRDQLLNKVRERTSKVRRSRHFVPIAAALIVAMSFGFLQYNSVIFATFKSFVSPGSIKPANLIVDPTTDTKVSDEPKINIPKINVDYHVSYDVPSIEESVVQEKLKLGVVHYPIPGANAMPGQKGNTVILGHSSNDVFDDGVAKFAFVQLDNLQKGDTFYLNYQGTRYTYSVTEKKVIKPTQVGELVLNTDKPMATLVTCTPIGTALNRLVVFAEQISPDPDMATAAPEVPAASSDNTHIPGDSSPTLFERLFGSN